MPSGSGVLCLTFNVILNFDIVEGQKVEVPVCAIENDLVRRSFLHVYQVQFTFALARGVVNTES